MVDFSAGQGDRRSAQRAQHVAALARNAHLEADQIVQRIDFLAEPAAHLVAGIGGLNGFDAELGRQFVPQFLAAAKIDPAHDLLRGHAEGHSGEERIGAGFGRPVIFGAMIHVGRAIRDGIEAFKRWDEFASRIDLHFHQAVRHLLDTLRNAFGRFTQTGQALGPGGDHVEATAIARNGRRGKVCRLFGIGKGGCGPGKAERACPQQVSSMDHLSSPCRPELPVGLQAKSCHSSSLSGRHTSPSSTSSGL